MAGMSFEDWKNSLRSCLKSRRLLIAHIDEQEMAEAFADGVSPAIYAQRATVKEAYQPIAPYSPPSQVERKPFPQSAAVMNDPKYQLFTGFDFVCPICGSSFIKVIGKPGSGLSYWGSLGWVAAGMVFESFLKGIQSQVYQCGYCEATFTQGASLQKDQ